MRKFVAKSCAGALVTLACSAYAAPALLDGLPWGASRAEFMKRFPAAKELFSKQSPARDTLMVLRPQVAAVDGFAIETLMRTFVGEQSCAVGLGFGHMTQQKADQLAAALRRQHRQLVREHKPTPERYVVFMGDEVARAAITQLRDSETPGRVSVVYSVVLNSCPVEVARDHQVIAPSR